MNIYFIVPALSHSRSLDDTLESIRTRFPQTGHVIVVCPFEAKEAFQKATAGRGGWLQDRVEVVAETGPGVYRAFNDGIQRFLGKRGDNYAWFLGSGDLVLANEDEMSVRTGRRFSVICGRVEGDETAIRWTQSDDGGAHIGRLPHHQAMIYSARLQQKMYFDERFEIYADVLQRVANLNGEDDVGIVDNRLARIAPPGVSGVRDLAQVRRHIAERLRLSWSLYSDYRQVALAARYLGGTGNVLRRWLSHRPKGLSEN